MRMIDGTECWAFKKIVSSFHEERTIEIGK